ncbi:MAG TPA: hypothetical protein V6C52_12200 [Coleofasciculaceae cyanobacterium]|jgi:hypothetical protein
MVNSTQNIFNAQVSKPFGIQAQKPLAQAALKFGSVDEFIRVAVQTRAEEDKAKKVEAEAKRKAEQEARERADALKKAVALRTTKSKERRTVASFMNEKRHLLDTVIATRTKDGKPITFTALDILKNPETSKSHEFLDSLSDTERKAYKKAFTVFVDAKLLEASYKEYCPREVYPDASGGGDSQVIPTHYEHRGYDEGYWSIVNEGQNAWTTSTGKRLLVRLGS